MEKTIKYYGKIHILIPVENRRTFMFHHKDNYSPSKLYLVKEIFYRNCFGVLRSKLIIVHSVYLYWSQYGFSIKKYQTQLLSEYEETRKKNRLYLKNYKKVMNAGK